MMQYDRYQKESSKACTWSVAVAFEQLATPVFAAQRDDTQR